MRGIGWAGLSFGLTTLEISWRNIGLASPGHRALFDLPPLRLQVAERRPRLGIQCSPVTLSPEQRPLDLIVLFLKLLEGHVGQALLEIGKGDLVLSVAW